MPSRPRKALGPAKPVDPDRLPPHAVEAEQALLGCIMLNPDLMPMCITTLPDGGGFYDVRHQVIYQSLNMLFDAGVSIDTVTLSNDLRKRNQLEPCGGISYVASLPEAAPNASNIDHYVAIVSEKFRLRELIRVGTEIVQSAFEEAHPVGDIIDEAEHRVLQIAHRKPGQEAQNARTLVTKAMRSFAEIEQKGRIDGISTGFRDLDDLTGGFHEYEMIVIAARPSVGKSSLLLNMADNIAVAGKTPVGIISMEMPADRMMQRMLCARAGVNRRNLSARNPQDAEALHSASKILRAAPIFIDFERGMTLVKLKAKARRMVSEHGVKVLGIDYLQLLSAPGHERKNEEVAAISTGLYSIAYDLGIAVVALSQLSRELEKDKHRAPRLSDLAQSGSIEQDADTVLLLWPKRGDEEDQTWRVRVGAQVAKQRDGATGGFDLIFQKDITRFHSVAREDEAEAGDMI